MRRFILASALFVVAVPLSSAARAQGTVADYRRAITLRDRYQGLAVDVPEQVQWIRNTSRFWYRKSVPGGNSLSASQVSRSPAAMSTLSA